MSKTIESPVAAKWPGTITLFDPLTFPQVQAIEDAIGDQEEFNKLSITKKDVKILPAVILCVEKWDLAGFIADPFPATPRVASSQLVRFVFNEIMKVYLGEKDIPNESSPLPIGTRTAESDPQN